MHVVALVAPVCSSLPRCVMCSKVLSWCCVTLWWAMWITPWCTTWSGDSPSSNCTSYTTCWRYSQWIPAQVPQLIAAAHPPPFVLSGGRPPVLLFRSGHIGRSVLDCHGTKGEEESTHRRDSSLSPGRALCLYPWSLVSIVTLLYRAVKTHFMAFFSCQCSDVLSVYLMQFSTPSSLWFRLPLST